MALTSDYTFRLDTATSTGVVLNDDSLSFPFVDIQTALGLDSAPYRETIRDHEGVDGGFIDAEFETGREVILEGVIYTDPTTVEVYTDSLKANFAPVTTPIPLYFKAPGVSERLVFVKPRGVRYNWEQLRRTGMTNAQFLMYAEDPRLYDSASQTVVIGFGGLLVTGFGFNFGFPVGFGTVLAPSSTNVTNSGNRPTPAVITVTGPATNPVIFNTTLGLSLNFNIVLGSTDTLVIDLAYKTVLLNGVTNVRGSLIAPTWWLLQPGINNIAYGAGLGVGSSISITFRSAWR